jgi:GTP cyclohydrolase II
MQTIIQHLPEKPYQGPASLSTVQRIAEARLPTESGDFQILGYRSVVSSEEYIALVRGIPRPDRASLVI